MAGLVRRFVVLAGAMVVLLGTAAGIADGATGGWTTAGRAAATGSWGQASEVPGTAALNAGGLAQISRMSCASTGNCSAGGEYVDGSSHRQVFVVSEVGGHWGMAMEVPGFAALNAGGLAQISGMSCASAGNCSAGGDYTDSTGHGQAFVVSEVGGRWGKAVEVPGTLNADGNAALTSVSCGSAGNCSAGGNYTDSSGNQQAFVVSQVRGVWGTAEEVPGTAVLNAGGNASVTAVSCASSGNCSAGGEYLDGAGHPEPFVVSQVSGRWGTAKQVPGTDAGGFVLIQSLSCASAGNCSAGLDYSAGLRHQQVFVVSEVGGRWGRAEEVPGTATLNARGDAQFGSLSCGSAGNCSAGGFYTGRAGHSQAFVVSQVRGKWGTAEEVPGTATLNAGGDASVQSVSCAAVGNCSAGGFYTGRAGGTEALVVSEVGGRWGTAKEVPGVATLNTEGDASVQSVSCAAVGNCSAGGFYTDSSDRYQAFVVSQSAR